MRPAGEAGRSGERPENSKFKLDIRAEHSEGEVITIYRNGEFTRPVRGPACFAHWTYRRFQADPRGQRLLQRRQERYPSFSASTAPHLRTKLKYRPTSPCWRRPRSAIIASSARNLISSASTKTWRPAPRHAAAEWHRHHQARRCRKRRNSRGYQRVRTPHIARESMYLCSGHLPYYADSMFPPMEFHEDEAPEAVKYYLKLTNYPHHHKLFGAVRHSFSASYPLRLAEYGTCSLRAERRTLWPHAGPFHANERRPYLLQTVRDSRAVNEMAT